MSLLTFVAVLFVPVLAAAEPVRVGFEGFRPERQVDVRHDRDAERLTVSWPLEEGQFGRLVLDLKAGRPLIESMGVAPGEDPTAEATPFLRRVDPVYFVTVGSRVNPPGRPPGMSVFNVFFDSPARRPHQTYRAALASHSARVSGQGGRASVTLDGLSAGPFSGELRFTVYAGARLVYAEALVSTQEADRAFVYDAGLAAASRDPEWQRLDWIDPDGTYQTEAAKGGGADRAIGVRYRAAVATSAGGSVACFPPPHQFFYPRDLTDNQKTIWAGCGHLGLDDRNGFGIRQTTTGGGNFVPWFNAPPGTEQRLGVFYLLGKGSPALTLAEVLRYTHSDRFPDLPGHVTFTSHWHMATAVAAMEEISRGKGRTTPDFVKMFRDMNVNIVHLAEFHGDGHPQDPGPLRLPEMKAMFDECERLSDDRLLFLPGEEANVYFGVSKPGQHPGHWLYLFPRPVSWTMKRAPGQPFEEDDPRYGKVYHVGSPDDLTRLLRTEHGLAWTAHPRIKASNWAPDAYRDADYFKAEFWLGGAWKAMPADLSRPKLGERVLDLLDDMANWGGKKYALGEVDVFKLDHTHELFGHMNVNYLRLDRVPRYRDDWTPVLDALRGGRFFVTTGEVLLTEFAVGGAPSGATLKLPPDGRPALSLGLSWTFPMAFAEVVSGDGVSVYRERVDLSDTPPFGQKQLELRPDLGGRKWVRVEAWDVAADGAFSQPVWLEPPGAE
jgi:hypothetical protein